MYNYLSKFIMLQNIIQYTLMKQYHNHTVYCALGLQ